MKEFLASLHESGDVIVPPLGGAEPATPDPATRAVLVDMDRAARMNLAGDEDPPALNLRAAWWAARILHRACQFLLCRDAGPDAMARGLGEGCPSLPRNLSVDYSVDLVFRFLPDLWTIALRAAPADALGEELTRLARAWPLSSVGVDDLGPGMVLGPFLAHPSLRALYADRIVERADVSRLGADPRVDDAVAAALGAHGAALCPKVAAWLAASTAPVSR